MGWTTHMVFRPLTETQQEDQQGGGIGRQTSAEASALKLGGRGKTSRLKGGVYVCGGGGQRNQRVRNTDREE